MNLKKITAVALSVMIVTAQVAACAANNSVDYSWAEKEIEYCRENGIMNAH